MPGLERRLPDLEAVAELCRLALAAGRLGCRVRLVDVDPDLRALIVLAGVELLLDDDQEEGLNLR